jgi:hypothetical protein
MDKSKFIELLNYSNPKEVIQKAYLYFGENIPIYISSKPEKKYMVENPEGKLIHFGQMGYEDFTKHNDIRRQQAYLRRTLNIRGNWKNDKYSPNNLSRNILW